jgi:hypothetical protein
MGVHLIKVLHTTNKQDSIQKKSIKRVLKRKNQSIRKTKKDQTISRIIKKRNE